MTATFLPAASRVAAPWRNGGGVTWEVMAYPANADMSTFLWRLSIAEVGTAGPFSVFDRVDRTLAVLEGELDLAIGQGGGARRLNPASGPFGFSGDEPAHGSPVGGRVLDLNAMARRGRFVAQMKPLAAGEALRPHHGALLIVAAAPLVAACGACEWRLGRLDALHVDEETIEITEEAPGARLGYCVRFSAASE